MLQRRLAWASGWVSVTDLLRDETSSARVRLDPRTILTVQDLRVFEQDVRNIVVALPANTADAETVTTVAVHPGDGDIITTSHGDTIVLIQHRAIPEDSIVARADIETIRVMCSSQTIRAVVGSGASCVVEHDIFHHKRNAAGDGEAVRRVVLDVQISNRATAQ